MDYETRLDMIVMHAWKTWTNNGLNMDVDDRYQTTKSIQDAANNAYTDNITDEQWLKVTLQYVGYKKED